MRELQFVSFSFFFNFHFEVLTARKLGMSEYDINHHRKQRIAILGLNIFKFLEIQDRCALPISSDMAEKKKYTLFPCQTLMINLRECEMPLKDPIF